MTSLNFKTIGLSCIIIISVFSFYSFTKGNKSYNEYNEWTKTIDNHKIGFISTGTNIKESIKLISDYYLVTYDSLQDAIEDYYNYFYQVQDNSGNIEFLIFPDDDQGKGIDFIYSFEVISNQYKIIGTDISVGKKVKDIDKYFTLTDLYFDYNYGLFLYSNDFSGAFSIIIDSTHNEFLENNFFENPENVHKESTIKSIIVY